MEQATQKRPSAPMVFGVLSIVFASLTILSTLLSGCAAALGQNSGALASFGKANPAAVTEAYNVYYHATRPATLVHVVLFLTLSIALLFIGIGQLRYRGWARRWSVVWGGVALVALIATVLVTRAIVGPATRQLFASLAQAAPAGSLDAQLNRTVGSLFGGGGFTTALTLILYAPYPAILLGLFTRPRLVAAMRD